MTDSNKFDELINATEAQNELMRELLESQKKETEVEQRSEQQADKASSIGGGFFGGASASGFGQLSDPQASARVSGGNLISGLSSAVIGDDATQAVGNITGLSEINRARALAEARTQQIVNRATQSGVNVTDEQIRQTFEGTLKSATREVDANIRTADVFDVFDAEKVGAGEVVKEMKGLRDDFKAFLAEQASKLGNQ